MNRWMLVVVTALALTSAPLPLAGQERWSAGSGPQAQRPPAPAPGSSQPSPPPNVAAPLFRSTLIARPPAAPDQTPLPLHSPWLGLVFFDPYWLWPSEIARTPDTQAPPGAGDERPTGGIQLDYEPRRARVYVDGLYLGIVDDVSGYYRHLDLPAGPRRIELVAPGYDPLFVDVMVVPGRTTTYRGSLNRR